MYTIHLIPLFLSWLCFLYLFPLFFKSSFSLFSHLSLHYLGFCSIFLFFVACKINFFFFCTNHLCVCVTLRCWRHYLAQNFYCAPALIWLIIIKSASQSVVSIFCIWWMNPTTSAIFGLKRKKKIVGVHSLSETETFEVLQDVCQSVQFNKFSVCQFIPWVISPNLTGILTKIKMEHDFTKYQSSPWRSSYIAILKGKNKKFPHFPADVWYTTKNDCTRTWKNAIMFSSPFMWL